MKKLNASEKAVSHAGAWRSDENFQDRFTLLDPRCELPYEFPEIEKGFV